MDEKFFEVGPITVFFPTAGDRAFSIDHDLAGLFGLEFNYDAERKLRAALKERPKGRLSIESEADTVLVRASNVELAAHVLRTIARLSTIPFDVPQSAIEAMGTAPKPKRQKWRVGSVFVVPLDDGTWCFGQVVDSEGPMNASEALFEFRINRLADAPVDLANIGRARLLGIAHTTGTNLTEGRFRVVGESPPFVDPDSGPMSRSTSWEIVGAAANIWWGLAPWNFPWPRDQYNDFFMSGLDLPARAWFLGDEDLARLRSIERYGDVLNELVRNRIVELARAGD